MAKWFTAVPLSSVCAKVEKSTVPVRTADAVRRVLATNDKGIKFQVCVGTWSTPALPLPPLS
jgi:UDP-glucose 6-dehydrogenase